MNAVVEERLKKLPRSPGVYLMKDAQDTIIYVGKATDLRARVRQYFQGSDPRPFVRLLDRILADIDFVVTRTPKEALVLENTLIKKHRPRYNYMLRDDKTYLSLRVNTKAKWPRVEIVRERRDDGSLYFGPYHAAGAARMMVSVVNRHFQIRNCRDSMFRNRVRPCLQYQIKRCPAPCVLPVDSEEYQESIDQVLLFLGGRSDELNEQLHRRMMQASERLDFERAAQLRDQIEAVRHSLVPQRAVQTRQVDIDVIALYREGEAGQIVVASFEDGALNHLETWPVRKQLLDSPALIGEFIPQYYEEGGRRPPKEILLSEFLDDVVPLEELLSERRGSKVAVNFPRRGDKLQLVELALENAREHFLQVDDEEERLDDTLADLKKRLRLRQEPRSIECFDISNFQGEEVVASQVCFVDGQPDKSRYRRYIIQSVVGQDDFASMFEVLTRRTKRARQGTDPLPDLIIIDGGRGQLNAAQRALQELGFADQEIISLAESRSLGVDDEGHVQHSAERVFMPQVRDPITLPKTSDMVLLLTRIRDEAHRFAIAFNRERLARRRLRSELDDIPGIGPKRKAELLKHFGSLKKIKAASLEALEHTPGFSRQLAWSVFDFFHPGDASAPSQDGES